MNWNDGHSAVKKCFKARGLFSLSILAALLGAPALTPSAWGQQCPSGSVSVLTQHNDNNRTGANTNETILNTLNVNSNQFGFLFSLPVDDDAFSQPLYVPKVNVSGQGQHNVVYVTTVNDSLYAFDADNGALLWEDISGGTTSLVPSGERVPHSGWGSNMSFDTHCRSLSNPGNPVLTDAGDQNNGYGDFVNHIGIVGTPVIDLANNVLYVVVRTVNTTSGAHHQRLYAINITSGAINKSTDITATYPCTGGPGCSGGNVTFDPQNENQRAALTLNTNNMEVYVVWALSGDWFPTTGGAYGWVMSFDANPSHTTTYLNKLQAFATNPNFRRAGIWQSGQGPSVDSNNNLYCMTGNGYLINNWTCDGNTATYDGPAPSPWPGPPTNFGCSFLKLDQNLNLTGYFTPFNQQTLENGSDTDLGSAGCLLIPGTSLITGGGKEGKLYLVNTGTDMLNNYNTTSDNITNKFYIQQGSEELYGSPVYWNGPNGQRIYVLANGDNIKAYGFSGGNYSSSTPVNTGSLQSVWPGGFLSLSANGSTAGTGIVWSNMQFPTGNGMGLVAFDAANLTQLWASSPSDYHGYAKFVDPTIANGKVYQVSQQGQNQVVVYGLKNPNCSQTVASPWTGNNPVAVSGVAIDPLLNNVYVTDPSGNMLYAYNSATYASGTSPIQSIPFTNAWAVAVGPNSMVYVANRSTGAITMIDPNNGWAQKPFPCPAHGGLRCIFVDGNGNVYASYDGSSAGNLAIYDPAGEIMANQFTGMNGPTGVVKVGQTLYVVDAGNNRVVKFTQQSSNVFDYGASPAPTPVFCSFAPNSQPNGLAVDSQGNFYVATQSYGGGFQVFNPNWLPYNPVNTPISGVLDRAFGIAVDPTGAAYIAARGPQKLTKMSSCQVLPTATPTPTPACCQLAGSPWVSPTPSGASWGLALDPSRNWLCAAQPGALSVFQAYDGQPVETISDSRLNNAWVVAAGPSPYMYVGGRDGTICKVDVFHKTVTQLTTRVGAARGIFVAPDGTVYETADDNSIYVMDTSLTVTSFAPGAISGTALNSPSGILKITTSGTGGTLYIADPVNKRVVSLGLSDYKTFTSGSGAVVFLNGVNGPNNPQQMALLGGSQTGNFYVAGGTDSGYWFYKNQNPGWSTASPKSCTGGVFTSLGIAYGITVDQSGNAYYMNQNGAVFKVLPCPASGQPSKPMPLLVSGQEGSTATPTPTPRFVYTVMPTPTPTMEATATPVPGRVVAVPNLSRDGEPVKLNFYLLEPAIVQLALFNVAGEEVYQATLEGSVGENSFTWDLRNLSGSPVASGIYVYEIEIQDGSSAQAHKGKIAVFH
jgi:hypothetical protein